MKERNFIPFEETKSPEIIPWKEGNFARLHEIKDQPGKIIKSYSLKDFNSGVHPKVHTLDEIKDRLNYYHDFLTTHFGEYMPQQDIAITGEKTAEDKPKGETLEVYILTQKITPKLMDSDMEKEQFCRDIEEFIIKAGEAFIESAVKDDKGKVKGYFPDIKNEHFIYGTTEENPKPQTYFVDQYPVLNASIETLNMLVNHLTRDLWEFHRHSFKRALNKMDQINQQVKHLTESK